MIGHAFYFHVGLLTKKIHVTHFINSLKKRISVFHDLCFLCFNLIFYQFPRLDPTYIVKVNVETKDILELVKQIHKYINSQIKAKVKCSQVWDERDFVGRKPFQPCDEAVD